MIMLLKWIRCAPMRGRRAFSPFQRQALLFGTTTRANTLPNAFIVTSTSVTSVLTSPISAITMSQPKIPVKPTNTRIVRHFESLLRQHPDQSSTYLFIRGSLHSFKSVILVLSVADLPTMRSLLAGIRKMCGNIAKKNHRRHSVDPFDQIPLTNFAVLFWVVDLRKMVVPALLWTRLVQLAIQWTITSPNAIILCDTVQRTTLLEWIKLGPGSFTTKLDLQHVFRLIRWHPSDSTALLWG